MAEWSTAFVNGLPDSCFLHIKPGGEKDDEGKTTPRSLRMFPVMDASGDMDMPHLRNALARIPQADLADDVKTRLKTKAQGMLEKAGGRKMDELETEDLEGVDILAAVGPIHGHGSPPEGDRLTVEDLQEFEASARELAGELKIPVKLGHSKAQALARSEGLLDEDEQPAVGWVENVRVEGTKLLADLKRVPKKVAELIRSGAFRTRSVEFKTSYESQSSKKTYRNVLTGLALLGAKAPAVKTLDDIVALYATDELEEDVRTYDYYAEGGVVWDGRRSYRWLQSQVDSAINPGSGSQTRYWVRDVTESKALIEEAGIDSGRAWVVPFTVREDNIEISPIGEWTLARQQWVEAAKAFDEGLGTKPRGRADTSGEMAELTISDEAQAKIAEGLGLEGDVDETKLLEAIAAKGTELAEAKTKAEELERKANDQPQPSETELKELREKAEASERKLYELERDQVIEKALHEGRIKPADQERFEKLYEADTETTVKLLTELEPNTELARVYGSDDDGLTPESRKQQSDKQFSQVGDMLGIPEEERV